MDYHAHDHHALIFPDNRWDNMAITYFLSVIAAKIIKLLFWGNIQCFKFYMKTGSWARLLKLYKCSLPLGQEGLKFRFIDWIDI